MVAYITKKRRISLGISIIFGIISMLMNGVVDNPSAAFGSGLATYSIVYCFIYGIMSIFKEWNLERRSTEQVL